MRASGDSTSRPLTASEVEAVFEAMAAKADRIAFRYLVEGCECRAQLMIEFIEAMGIEPGRVWALTADRQLAVPDPAHPRRLIPWNNHVAPTVEIETRPPGLVVIDPSLSRTGPLSIEGWAAAMRVRQLHISNTPLGVSLMNELRTQAVLQGRSIDAFLFLLPRGMAPIPELGGSGFRLGADPAEGVHAFAHREMQRLLAEQAHLPPAR